MDSDFNDTNFTSTFEVNDAQCLIDMFDYLENSNWNPHVLQVVTKMDSGSLTVRRKNVEQFFSSGELEPGLYGIVWSNHEVVQILAPSVLKEMVFSLGDQIDFLKEEYF